MLQFTANKELKNSILQGELQIKEQQLKYLKMQIHPHFLFNTLNTLYAFALNKNEKTPEMILQLIQLVGLHFISNPKTISFSV